MTKEELNANIEKFSGMGNISTKTVKILLAEFFESNVCIPKGENRNPYADELHAFAEGINVEYNNGLGWKKAICDYGVKYRIKPSEPIYEYFVVDDKGITDWMTIQEFESNNDFKFIAEKTKRERK